MRSYKLGPLSALVEPKAFAIAFVVSKLGLKQVLWNLEEDNHIVRTMENRKKFLVQSGIVKATIKNGGSKWLI
jgi:hypothetical protein